jgi:hypothetical protein
VKKHKLFWLAMICLLVTGCATHQGGPGVNYDPDFCQWDITTLKQKLMVEVVEAKGNVQRELKPGEHYYVTTPRRDEIHIIVKIWEPHGWSSGKQLAPIKRYGRWSGIQQVIVDKHLVLNIVRQRGMVLNLTPWTISVTDDRLTNYGEIPPWGKSAVQELAPGSIEFYWHKKGSINQVRIRGLIDCEQNDVEIEGELYDWRCKCEP